MKPLLLILTFCLSGCSVIHQAEQHRDNLQVFNLLESYYIARENPENNRPNEQDSIKTLLINELKTLKNKQP